MSSISQKITDRLFMCPPLNNSSQQVQQIIQIGVTKQCAEHPNTCEQIVQNCVPMTSCDELNQCLGQYSAK